MRRPLVIVALLYTGGLLLGEYFQPPLPVLLALGLAVVGAAVLWARGRAWLLVPLLVLAGWANLTSRTAILSPHDLRTLLGHDAADIALRGTLAETPSVRMFVRDEKESFRTLALLEVTALRRGTNWLPATGCVLTVTPGNLAGVGYAGTSVEVSGILAPPPHPSVPGLFDYRAYLARQRVYFQLKADSEGSWRALERVRPPLADRFLDWAQRTLERGLPAQDEPLRLLLAMTLGWKTGLTNEVYAPFMQSGTMHIFAISGLHIALIAALLVALLRVLQIPRHWCGLVAIPLIWFYTAATGWQPSAIRSVIMMTVIIGGWALRRPSDLLNSLATAGLIILLWQPEQLFQASFQLSFFVVLSIALMAPPLQRWTDQGLAFDPMLPEQERPRWRRWLDTPLRWLTLSLTTSLAAWLGSLPLTAHYFHLFSPVTLLANLLIIPLSSAALACNLGSLLCGDWLPWLGELFNHSAWLWMALMVHISEWSITLPGAFWYVAEPSGWMFAAYYALLLGALSRWLFQPGNRRWGITAAALVLAGCGWEWLKTRDTFVLTVLPLEGGHAVFVDGPGRSNDWLIDCGNSNAVKFVTVPFLHAQGVNRLPRLALSHGDVRHVGGAHLLWDSIPTDTTVTSPAPFRSAAYRAILEALDTAPPQPQPHPQHLFLARGDTTGCWTVLHPAASERFPQADDASLVLLGQFRQTRVLLLGDLGRPGQEALMRHEFDLRADIVITGLPGQGEPLCDGLLERIQPQLIIVADAALPAAQRATQELLARFARRNVQVLTTRQAGAITLRLQRAAWTATRATPLPSIR
jgi:ComEC/Rec2-related protein